MDNLSDLLLNSDNDAAVSDQEVAAYAKNRSGGVPPQAPPAQPTTQIPNVPQQPYTASVHLRCLLSVIQHLKPKFPPEMQKRIDLLNSAIIPRHLSTQQYANELKNVLGPSNFNIWKAIMHQVQQQIQKIQQVQQAQQAQAQQSAQQGQMSDPNADQLRERRRQIHQQLEMRVKEEQSNASAPIQQPRIPIPSSSELGKRALVAGVTGPPAKRINVSVYQTGSPGMVQSPVPVNSGMKQSRGFDGTVVLNSGMIRNRVQAITQQFKIPNVDEDVLEFLNLALQERLRNVAEQLVVISQKRMEEKSDVFECITTSDPKLSLRMILQREQELAKKREEDERLRLEAIRKSKKDDKALRDKLSLVDQQKEDEQTNSAALFAVGNTRRRKPKYNRKIHQATKGSPSGASASEDSETSPNTSSLYHVRRITYKDALVFLERDECQLTPNFAYKCFLGKDLLEVPK